MSDSAEKKMSETQKKIDDLRQEIRKLENKKFREDELPSLKKMVGKYFMYPRNCYSCPEKESDYWSVYHKVVSVVGNSLRVNSFQITSQKEFIVKRKEYWSESGCIEISKERYEKAKKAFLKKLTESLYAN